MSDKASFEKRMLDVFMAKKSIKYLKHQHTKNHLTPSVVDSFV
ncbi:hypothetical protein [Alteromonas sediminis]|nr:hypothetical protein [Alteromonas sediminis]